MTRASMILFWLSLTIVVSLGLYHTSYRVEELGQRLRTLNAQIEEEQRSIHILKAEYVYLTDPSRIEEVSRKHLALQPTQPKQIVRLAKLKDYAPTYVEAMNGSGLHAIPIASLRPQAAAYRPQAAEEETGRLNTHLVIRKTARADAVPTGHALRLMADQDDIELATAGDEP